MSLALKKLKKKRKRLREYPNYSMAIGVDWTLT
jgi:hypothetical protein